MLNRIPIRAPVTAVKSYTVSAPASTHFRQGTCEEVRCPAFLNGFKVVADMSTDLGQAQCHYIEHETRMSWTVRHLGDNLAEYTFTPGQRCFKWRDHRVRLEERDEIYVVRDGDWRGNPTGRSRVHANASDWVDDFATHQDNLKTLIERG